MGLYCATICGTKSHMTASEKVALVTGSSSGIGLLVRYLTTAKQSGGAIRLLKPSKFTVQTLKMVGLLNLFSTYEDLSEAVASFQ